MYEGITVLRGVLQKETNPSNWSKISQLQSHSEERDEIEHARRLRQSCIHFVRQICGQSQCQEEDIDQVLGSIGVNAFVSDDGVSQAMLYRNGTYLYHIASMPAHNCTPNSSWLIQLNSDFHLRAATPIKSGSSVTFLYTEATLGTPERRRKLQENKYFGCGCPRCCDPAELGSFFSGVKCPQENCPMGYILPKTTCDPLSSGLEWSCDTCFVKSSSDFIASTIAVVDRQLSLVDPEDSFNSVEKLLKISQTHAGLTLHPHHSKIHDIDNDVLQRVSFLLVQQAQSRTTTTNSKKKRKQGAANMGTKWARVLVELSRKCLRISDLIWPGFNRHRGRLLYFLQQGLLILLTASFPQQSESKSRNKSQPPNNNLFQNDLQEILEIREEVFKIFQYEPEGREESYIAKAMVQDPPELIRLKSQLH